MQADLKEQRRQEMKVRQQNSSSDGQESVERDPMTLCANGNRSKQCHVDFLANNWHPYKIQMLQHLTEDDPDCRVEICKWTLNMHDNVSC
ncbi:hypothetical protein AVEN_220768-1 [Araneus ventricosus]|uniref:Uncharacterized protein n=1 Tax=Araneus ventricosus TaxID=182803 RepID=A0A4Y2LUX9_ARAVE|nr:hypothetical protein AVEN_220768-1 [Araneus ventricosus]